MTKHTANRIAALTATFRSAREKCMTAFDAGRAAVKDVPAGSPETTYAGFRLAAGAPSLAEEIALHKDMTAARTALATDLRAAMRGTGLAYPVAASDSLIVAQWMANR